MTVPGSNASYGPFASGLIVLEDGPWCLLRFPGTDEPSRYRLVWVDLTSTPHAFHNDPRPESKGDP